MLLHRLLSQHAVWSSGWVPLPARPVTCSPYLVSPPSVDPHELLVSLRAGSREPLRKLLPGHHVPEAGVHTGGPRPDLAGAGAGSQCLSGASSSKWSPPEFQSGHHCRLSTFCHWRESGRGGCKLSSPSKHAFVGGVSSWQCEGPSI